MAYEHALERAAIRSQARRARQAGQLREERAAIRREEDGGPLARENLLVTDITGLSLIGFGTLETMTT